MGSKVKGISSGLSMQIGKRYGKSFTQSVAAASGNAQVLLVSQMLSMGLISRREARQMLKYKIYDRDKLRKFLKYKDTPLWKVINGTN